MRKLATSTVVTKWGRNDGMVREGAMPGTFAIASSFSSKDGSRKFDMARAAEPNLTKFRRSVEAWVSSTF
jgi:hypothetical protein